MLRKGKPWNSTCVYWSEKSNLLQVSSLFIIIANISHTS